MTVAERVPGPPPRRKGLSIGLLPGVHPDEGTRPAEGLPDGPGRGAAGMVDGCPGRTKD